MRDNDRWLVRRGGLALAAASLALLVAACGGGATGSTPPHAAHHQKSTTARGHTSKPASATELTTAMVDQLFPRSGADFAVGNQYDDFAITQRAKITGACMRAQGFPAPPAFHDSGAVYGTVQQPNLPVIERTLNIGVTQAPAPSDPTKGMSKAEAAAYSAADTRCSAKPDRVSQVGSRGQAGALTNEWFNITEATVASGPVQALNAKAAACADRTAFPGNSVVAEIQEIEGKLTPLFVKGENAKAWATDRAGTRVFIRCFGPEVNLTVKLLTRRRAAFFSQHALTINQLEAAVNRSVAKLERMAHAS